MKLNSKLATLKIPTAGIEPIWANPEILIFLGWEFSTFFSILCPRSTRMKNRPYWMDKKSPKHHPPFWEHPVVVV